MRGDIECHNCGEKIVKFPEKSSRPGWTHVDAKMNEVCLSPTPSTHQGRDFQNVHDT